MRFTRAPRSLLAAAVLACVSIAPALQAQDWFHLETSSGAERLRIAVADFKPLTPDAAAYKQTFDTTLFADLTAAGLFDIVSKDMAPQTTPGFPAEINLSAWSAAPSSAAMVAFGNIKLLNNHLVVSGFLDDAKNAQYPQIFTKQYTDEPSEDSARQIAHRFADEIIFRLGGGVAGIAETKIYYIKLLGPNDKEVYEMDYDGANQHAITHIGTVAMSPRVSPDNSRLAFSALGTYGFQIKMFSLLLNRIINFPSTGGADSSPAWSPSGQQLAFSSARTGPSEIWVSDPEGNIAHKLTSFGRSSSPSWNPKTGAQIAFICGRSNEPQVYIMDADGSGVQRLTDGGYATSPSWSPNGQFLTFAWDRKYGPGAPGGQDIYVMEIATKKWIQLTHDGGRCDFPVWSPDGRHIVYANSPDGRQEHTRIMSMLADGTQKKVLTGPGADMPNWSWK